MGIGITFSELSSSHACSGSTLDIEVDGDAGTGTGTGMGVPVAKRLRFWRIRRLARKVLVYRILGVRFEG